MKFKSLSALESYLKNAIDIALENQVADMVKDEVAASASEVVYDAYNPSQYSRRLSLEREENIGIYVSGNVLTATMNHVFNEEYKTDNHGYGLAYLIEYGHGAGGYYDYPYSRKTPTFLEPRPFVETAIERMDSYKTHVHALKEGLESQGINVK